MNDEIDLRKTIEETLENLRDEDGRSGQSDRLTMIEAISRRTGKAPGEVEKVLRELEFGESNEGIHAHSPTSGSSGVENAG